jgi:hypothetical protein
MHRDNRHAASVVAATGYELLRVGWAGLGSDVVGFGRLVER